MEHIRRAWYFVRGIFLFLIISGSCLPHLRFDLNVHFLGRNHTLELSDSIAYGILQGKIPDDFAIFNKQNLDNQLMHRIGKMYSPDVATIYALNRLYEMPENKSAQDQYLAFVDSMKNSIVPRNISKLWSKYFLFIPGFGYQDDTTTGADFARQISLFNTMGIRNELIETKEYGLVEANARTICDRIIELSKVENDIVLVSVSKGGLETAIALGKFLNEVQLQNVSGWVSVGGILRGSPIADQYLEGPKLWVTKLMLLMKGIRIDIVKDISHKFRSTRFQSLNFPGHIKVINFIGMPLAFQVQQRIKRRYCFMQKRFGPNDGLTTLPDAIAANGITISELGLDHYYEDADIDLKALALACLL